MLVLGDSRTRTHTQPTQRKKGQAFHGSRQLCPPTPHLWDVLNSGLKHKMRLCADWGEGGGGTEGVLGFVVGTDGWLHTAMKKKETSKIWRQNLPLETGRRNCQFSSSSRDPQLHTTGKNAAGAPVFFHHRTNPIRLPNNQWATFPFKRRQPKRGEASPDRRRCPSM